MKFYLLETSECDAAFFTSCFGECGHEVSWFKRPIDLLDALRLGRPNVVVQEWDVPEMPGHAVLRRVRELYGATIPIIVLSKVDRVDAIIQAFKAGADDYLLKPMTRPVLIARIESLMRKLSPVTKPAEASTMLLSNGPYRFDFAHQTAHIEDVAVSVTPKELDLAWLFFNSLERFIPKTELIASVWGKRAEIASHTVTQHLHIVRKKLKLRDHGYHLATIYGSGYRLSAPA